MARQKDRRLSLSYAATRYVKKQKDFPTMFFRLSRLPGRYGNMCCNIAISNALASLFYVQRNPNTDKWRQYD